MHLAEEARYQEGVFSRQQALGSGMSAQQVRRRFLTGSWTKVANNVYADSGLKMTTAAWRWAAVLSCGPEAVLSHRSAAEMWGMPVAPPNRTEITVAHHARVRPGPKVMVHSAAMDASDVAGLRGIALTSQRRTVLDCLLILPTNQGRSLLDRALQRAGFNFRPLPPPCARPVAGPVSPVRGLF